MVGCGIWLVLGVGAGVSGCEFRGSGWGWDRRTHTIWGGGVATRNTGPYIRYVSL